MGTADKAFVFVSIGIVAVAVGFAYAASLTTPQFQSAEQPVIQQGLTPSKLIPKNTLTDSKLSSGVFENPSLKIESTKSTDNKETTSEESFRTTHVKEFPEDSKESSSPSDFPVDDTPPGSIFLQPTPSNQPQILKGIQPKIQLNTSIGGNNRCDANSNGQLSADEIDQIISSEYTQFLVDRFVRDLLTGQYIITAIENEVPSSNHNNIIDTQEELQRLNQMFVDFDILPCTTGQQCDTNLNGIITFDELKQFLSLQFRGSLTSFIDMITSQAISDAEMSTSKSNHNGIIDNQAELDALNRILVENRLSSCS